MGVMKKTIALYAVLLFISTISSFHTVAADEATKSEEQSSDKETSASEDSSQEDSKEKRSREEILFGNQQNKPSGLVDDLMSMSDADDTEEAGKDFNKKISVSEDELQGVASSRVDSDKKEPHQDQDNSDMLMAPGSDSWYNTVPVSSSALQYLSNAPGLHTLPSADFSNSLYDQEDLYRRKRQLLTHPLPLRKRRSLRSSLGQMIQKRGLRMPRRSMRLKRQVDVEDILSLLENDRYFDEQQQQVPTKNPDGWGSKKDKKHVPYPETQDPEFRYNIPYVFQHKTVTPESSEPEFRYSIPYTFQHKGDGVFQMRNDLENKADNLENQDDIDTLMLLHPNARYVDTPDIGILPYSRSRDEEGEAFQKWLARHTTPNIISVSRRSAPTFYPLDYRYIPGYKKRSMIFSNGNRMPNGFSGDNEAADTDFGKWGHVVQVPEAYASAEDVARLYGLATLMAEGDEEAKMRRSV